jgi:signal transduction histidine kinase
MPTDAQPNLDELYARARIGAFIGLIRSRRLFLPVLALLVAWIGIDDGTVWRMSALLGVATVMLGVALVDGLVERRTRDVSLDVLSRQPVGPLLVVQVVIIATIQTIVFVMTGGMASPLLPGCLPVVFLAALFLSARVAWATVAIMVPLLWLMALAQARGIDLAPRMFAFADGHPAQPPALALTLAGVMTIMLTMLTKMGMLTRAAIDEMVGQALLARDGALRARAEQAHELTTLSAEIAHELKNPLASIKGLAALIDRELSRGGEAGGKSLERLGVLRREVDRMQGILDEFLNFSRPLVPLAQRSVVVRELVDHVIVLHEALAAERRVELVASGDAEAYCDPRKVEQILINLVQNALHVAPSGSQIELELASTATRVRVCVRDEGPGMDDELRARVFEPGITTKQDGSGLGLTVARALARQHGGELELGPRRDGRRGCEATLELPLAGLSAQGAAA